MTSNEILIILFFLHHLYNANINDVPILLFQYAYNTHITNLPCCLYLIKSFPLKLNIPTISPYTSATNIKLYLSFII